MAFSPYVLNMRIAVFVFLREIMSPFDVKDARKRPHWRVSALLCCKPTNALWYCNSLLFRSGALYFETSTVPWHPTHLVPVLWVHLFYFNEVACHLTVTHLGCQVQHGKEVICLLTDSFSKQRRQEPDDLIVPTFCSHVHGILAVLHRETIQVQDTVLAHI